MSTGGRKRPFVPKQTKHAKQNDAKRRKLDNENHRGSKNTDKSDDKQHTHKKKNTKFGDEPKFGSSKSGKTNTNADKSNSSNSSNAAASKKKLKKTKPKKPKGKKKSHRNKNKWDECANKSRGQKEFAEFCTFSWNELFYCYLLLKKLNISYFASWVRCRVCDK